MAGGFFKNVGGDIRRLVEESFLEGYKHKLIFHEETFEYTYTRSNGITESQTYTYKSLISELQKKNINIIDINIAPADAIPMFCMLRLTCIFKNGERPITIHVISHNLEPIMDNYYSGDNKV